MLFRSAGLPFGPIGSLVGQVGGGALGAFAPSFIQQFGGDIERQAAEQAKAGKPVEIERGAALEAAVPQGILDAASKFIPFGRPLMGKLFGAEVKQLLDKGATKGAEKLAQESIGKVLAKGTLIGGLAEVPTEIAQQVLERAQAGLSLTDDDALKEYVDTAYQVGLLAPLGAAGRLAERGEARGIVTKQQALDKRQAQLAQMAQEEQDRQQKEAADAAEEARKQTPDFAIQAQATWTDMQQRIAALQEKTRAKVEKDDLIGQADKQDAIKQLQALKKSDEFKQARDDFMRVRPLLSQMQAEQAAQAAAQTQQRMDTERFAGPMQQQDLFGAVAPAELQPSTVTYQTPGGAPITPVGETVAAAAPDRRVEFAQKQQEISKQIGRAHV